MEKLKTTKFNMIKIMENSSLKFSRRIDDDKMLREGVVGTVGRGVVGTGKLGAKIAAKASEPVTTAIYGESPSGLIALNIPMVLPSSVDGNTAKKLGFIQQGRISEQVLASLEAEVANSTFKNTKQVLSKFMEENETFCKDLEKLTKQVEKLEEVSNIDGAQDFSARAKSTGIAKSPYTFLSFKFTKKSLATSMGLGSAQEVVLRIGLKVYSIFEKDKTLAEELYKVFKKQDKLNTIFKRLKNRNKFETSMLDVLRGKDVVVQRKKQSRDLASKDLSLIMSKVFVQDKSWLSSIERNKIGGSIVITPEIVEYLEDFGYDLTDPSIAKQFMVYSKAYDLYIVDVETDTVFTLDKQSFAFHPYKLSTLIDDSRNSIKRATIDFS